MVLLPCSKAIFNFVISSLNIIFDLNSLIRVSPIQRGIKKRKGSNIIKLFIIQKIIPTVITKLKIILNIICLINLLYYSSIPFFKHSGHMPKWLQYDEQLEHIAFPQFLQTAMASSLL